MNKYSLQDFNHFAIIQTAFLGDVTLSLYLAQAIRDKHKTANITFVTTPIGSTVVSLAKSIDNIVTYDKHGLQRGLNGINRISEMIRERNTECIIAPHRSFRTTLLTYFSKPEFSVGFNKNALSFFYSKRLKYYKHYHEVERNISLLRAFNNNFNIDSKQIKIDLDIHPADISFIENKLNFLKINDSDILIVLAPGSVWNTKRWIDEYFVELIRYLTTQGFKSILIGSKDEFGLCQRISVLSHAINLAGELSIPQVIYLLTKSNLLITNDSAPTHLAGLVNCPTLTIYGPTSPIFGFYPRGQFDKVVEIDNLKCKPCSIHGTVECPIKTHKCMKDLKPNIVFENAIEILKNTNSLTHE